MPKIPTLDEARIAGRSACQTEGSQHYQANKDEGNIEPLDLMIAKGIAEDFCLGSIIKYATRFKKTRNVNDLKKVSDYAQIMAGIHLYSIDAPREVGK